MKKKRTSFFITEDTLIVLIVLSMITPVLALQNAPQTPAPLLVKDSWIERYNGVGNNYDAARTIDLDAAGNVYVTGCSLGLPGETEPAHFDIVTVKYNPEGTQLWIAVWTNPHYNMDDFPSSMTVDPEGNVYVIGKTLIGQNEFEIITIKYNTAGVKQWEDSYYAGINTALDYPDKIFLDGQGHVYITATVNEIDDQFDILIIKYTTDGDRVWVKTYDGEEHRSDIVQSIVVQDDAVIVLGESQFQYTGSDTLTLRYTVEGEFLWAETYDRAGMNDVAVSAVIDEERNIYVAGSSNSERAYLAYDYVILKYTPAGDVLWVHRYDALADDPENISIEFVSDIQLNIDGTLVVTGKSTNWIAEQHFPDYYGTLCYTRDGDLLWVDRYYVYRGERPALAIDHVGNIYIGGSCILGTTSHDYFTARYNINGERVWEEIYDNNQRSYWDKGTDLAIDDHGNVFITGLSTGLETEYDYTTIKYSQNEPPVCPRNPSPEHEATDIPLDVTLQWFSGSLDIDEPVTYDVYFGTSQTPEKIVANQTQLSHQLEPLAVGQTYYWRIVAWDSTQRSTIGPLWRFTTTDDATGPAVTITKPAAGKIYIADQEKGTRLFFSQIPLIIGKITVELSVSDAESGVQRVEIFIDDVLKETLTAEPYEWLWEEQTFFKHAIKIVAYDTIGNNRSVELIGQKFF